VAFCLAQTVERPDSPPDVDFPEEQRSSCFATKASTTIKPHFLSESELNATRRAFVSSPLSPKSSSDSPLQPLASSVLTRFPARDELARCDPFLEWTAQSYQCFDSTLRCAAFWNLNEFSLHGLFYDGATSWKILLKKRNPHTSQRDSEASVSARS
jgi:hypothetical protein